MKSENFNLKKFLSDCSILIFIGGTIGIALKFMAYFNQWVYFPYFPNILDSAFLICSAVILGSKALKKDS